MLENLKKTDPLLLEFWERLKIVKEFTLHARTRSKNEAGWNGNGKGNVLVSQDSAAVLTFYERGDWQVQKNQNITFSNTLRWTLDLRAGMISLEHLRQGSDNPVFLCYLAPTGNQHLASVEPHLCKEDTYTAQVAWDRHHIRLSWRIIGPKKNEEQESYYI